METLMVARPYHSFRASVNARCGKSFEARTQNVGGNQNRFPLTALHFVKEKPPMPR